MRGRRGWAAVLVPALIVGLAVTLSAAAYPRALVLGSPVAGLQGTTNKPLPAERLPVRLTWARHDSAILLTTTVRGCHYRVTSTTSTAPNRVEATLVPRTPHCHGPGPRQRLHLPHPTVFGPPDAVSVLIDGHGYRIARSPEQARAASGPAR